MSRYSSFDGSSKSFALLVFAESICLATLRNDNSDIIATFYTDSLIFFAKLDDTSDGLAYISVLSLYDEVGVVHTKLSEVIRSASEEFTASSNDC